MARITHFSVDDAHPRVKVEAVDSPTAPITIIFTADVWARLICDEAAQLRDDLTLAIEEATLAQQAAA